MKGPHEDAGRSPLPFAPARGGRWRGSAGAPLGGAAPWGPPPVFTAPPAEARAALASVYDDLEDALASVAGTCCACGRCCRFRPGGIVLFAGSLELAVLVAEAGPPNPDRLVPGPATAAWVCPYQEGDLCTAREVRPLGCRTYFCDAEAAGRGRGLHAEVLREIRAVAGAHDYPWWYGPAKTYFGALVAAG